MIAGKAALLGVLGIGLVSTGGVAITNPSLMGFGKGRQVIPLGKEYIQVMVGRNNKELGDMPEGSFRKVHDGGRYLVGVDKHNRWWWEKQYAKIANEIKDNEKFKVATTGFDKDFRSGKITSLNTVCWDAYRTQDSEIKDAQEAGKYIRSDIWKYCSELGEKPKTIKEEEADNGKYTQDNGFVSEALRGKLISTTGNDKFWAMKEEDFRTEDSRFGDELYRRNNKFFDKKKSESIRELCGKAYGMTKDNQDEEIKSAISDYIDIFCSLIGDKRQ